MESPSISDLIYSGDFASVSTKHQWMECIPRRVKRIPNKIPDCDQGLFSVGCFG